METIIKALLEFSDEELIQEINRRKTMKRLKKVNKVFKIVCEYYSVTEASVLDRGEKGFARGTGPVRNAKRALMYILRFEYDYKTEKVGLLMGKNHSTVTIASNKVKGEMEVNPNYKKEINFLITLINHNNYEPKNINTEV